MTNHRVATAAAVVLSCLLVACGGGKPTASESPSPPSPSAGQVAGPAAASRVSFYAASRFAEQVSFGATPALVGQHFPPDLATRALALAHRYVDYRVALGQLRPPADQTDPQALRTVMAERQRVRRQFFDGDEFDALFSQDLALDEYMLARLEIERNSALTPEQKRSALQEAEQGLDPAVRAQRAEAVAHEGVAQQTAAFNAQGVDERTRHAQRSAQYGPEAAQRLAQLDREQGDWNARLDLYQQAVASTQDPTRLASLRSQLFSSEEQLRVEAALAARATPSPK